MGNVLDTAAMTSTIRLVSEQYLKNAARRQIDPARVASVLARAFGLHPDEADVGAWMEEWDTAVRIEDNPNPSDWDRLIPDKVPYRRATDWLLDYATDLHRSCDWLLNKIVAS